MCSSARFLFSQDLLEQCTGGSSDEAVRMVQQLQVERRIGSRHLRVCSTVLHVEVAKRGIGGWNGVDVKGFHGIPSAPQSN